MGRDKRKSYGCCILHTEDRIVPMKKTDCEKPLKQGLEAPINSWNI